MQHSRKGCVRIVRQRIPQRQGAMGGQLGDEPFRQRLEAVVLIDFGLRRRSTASADADNGALRRAAWLAGGWGIAIGAGDRLGRWFVFRTDVAALDPEFAVAVNADEYTGACDTHGIVHDRPFFERRERGLDFAEPAVYLVRQFLNVSVFLLKAVSRETLSRPPTRREKRPLLSLSRDQTSRRFVFAYNFLHCSAWSDFRNEAEQIIRGLTRL